MAAAAANVVKRLLVRAHSPNTAEQIFKDKVQYKPLHLRPTSPDPTSQDARAHRRLQRVRKCQKASRKRQKPKPLSAKDRRILNVYDIPEELRKYDIYVPLNEMWVKYMWDILGLKEGQQTLVNAGSSGNVLATADYHGAKVTVVRSKCPSLVNLKGIVAKDTKFTFQIITEKNEFKIIPKRSNVFSFEIPQPEYREATVSHDQQPASPRSDLRSLTFEVNGSHLDIRPADRARKAFKPTKMLDI